MNLDYLKEFLDLANTLNFTKSAANLHMTQSTLSRHISALEKEIGTPLFTRSTNSVKLTQNGRLLYEKSCALVADYSDAISEMQANAHRQVHTLNVAGSTVQPTVMRLFTQLATRASYERLPVRFEYHKVRTLSNEPPAPYPVDALREGDLDLVIDPCEIGAQPPRGIDSITICDEPLVILASTDNVLARAEGLCVEDLFANTLVTFAIQQHCSRILSSPLRAAGYSPQRIKTVFVDNVLEIPERLGQLAEDEIVPMQATLCKLFGYDQADTDRITLLDVPDDRMRTSLWALFRKNDQNDGVRCAVQLLEDMIEERKSTAALDMWSRNDVLMSTAFYC